MTTTISQVGFIVPGASSPSHRSRAPITWSPRSRRRRASPSAPATRARRTRSTTAVANYHGTSSTNSTYYEEVYNYEPTALPVTIGGYSWVAFTSRRLYGKRRDDRSVLERSALPGPDRHSPRRRRSGYRPSRRTPPRAPTRATPRSIFPVRSCSPATRARTSRSRPARRRARPRRRTSAPATSTAAAEPPRRRRRSASSIRLRWPTRPPRTA